MAPTLAVVIPVYNNSFYTRLCFESLQKTRETEPSYELIVVDNGSSDDTPRVLAEYAGLVSQVIRNDKNRGFARASNQGAKAAGRSVRHIVFLNNDIVVEAGWLRELARTAADPRVGIVGARLLYPNGTIQHAGIAFGPNLSIYHAWAGQPADSTAVLKRRERQAVTGACMLVERELFESLGGFDEGYANSFEDIDLCLRARELGRRIVYCPESVAHHFESVTPGRLFRDDCNYDRFRARWLGRAAPDSDLLSPPLAGAVSEAALLLSEFESLAERAHALEIENARLVESLGLDASDRANVVSSEPTARGGGASDRRPAFLSRRLLSFASSLIGGFNAEYAPEPLPMAFAGSRILHPVTVRNIGLQDWRANQFSLACHWRPAQGVGYAHWDGRRAPLAFRTEPGESHVVLAHVELPEEPGDYILEWDLTEEGIAWLSWEGVVTFQQVVRVIEPPARRAVFSDLPTTVPAGEPLSVRVQLDGCAQRITLLAASTAGHLDSVIPATPTPPLAIAWEALGGRLVGQPSPLVASEPVLIGKVASVGSKADNRVATADLSIELRLQAPETPGAYRLLVVAEFKCALEREGGSIPLASSLAPIRTLGGLVQVRPTTSTVIPHFPSYPVHRSGATYELPTALADARRVEERTEYDQALGRARLAEGEGLRRAFRLVRRYAASFVHRRLPRLILNARKKSDKAGYRP